MHLYCSRMGVAILRLIRLFFSIMNIHKAAADKENEENDVSVCVTWVERTATCKECKESKEI